MSVDVVTEWAAFFQRAGQNQSDLVLTQHIGDPVFAAGFQSAVGDRLESPGLLVVQRALLGISAIQFLGTWSVPFSGRKS